MPSISLTFHVHQPYRLRRYSVFDMGQSNIYEDDERNAEELLRAAHSCYLPMNELLMRCIHRYGDTFRVSFSFSGSVLDQFEQYAPNVLESFQQLVRTGCVEVIGSLSGHSLAALYSHQECIRQATEQAGRLNKLFDQTPRAFCNPCLISHNDLAKIVQDLGYTVLLTEGADSILDWRSPHYLYQSVHGADLKLLVRNPHLSEDLSLRFSRQDWSEYPLTAERFAAWCHAINGQGDVICLALDYETFGLRHIAQSGIFAFMETLPGALLAHPDFSFATPSECAQHYSAVGTLDIPRWISANGEARNLGAWLENDMQNDAVHASFALGDLARTSHAEDLYNSWLRLQDIDHLAAMNTQDLPEKQNLLEGSPFSSPYEVYISYMNILSDLEMRLQDVALRESAAQQVGFPKQGASSALKVSRIFESAHPRFLG